MHVGKLWDFDTFPVRSVGARVSEKKPKQTKTETKKNKNKKNPVLAGLEFFSAELICCSVTKIIVRRNGTQKSVSYFSIGNLCKAKKLKIIGPGSGRVIRYKDYFSASPQRTIYLDIRLIVLERKRPVFQSKHNGSWQHAKEGKPE